MGDGNKTTQNFVEAWVAATEALHRAERELQRARSVLTDAAAVLGKHLAPTDMKAGETVAIWARVSGEDRLVEIALSATGSVPVVRLRGGARREESR